MKRYFEPLEEVTTYSPLNDPTCDIAETVPNLSLNISETLASGVLQAGIAPSSSSYNHIENPADVGVVCRDSIQAEMISQSLVEYK